jgi:hypothetical protein
LGVGTRDALPLPANTSPAPAYASEQTPTKTVADKPGVDRPRRELAKAKAQLKRSGIKRR